MAAVESNDTPETPGEVTDRIETYRGKEIPSGFDGPFFAEIAERKKKGRDAKCLVTADDGATGVGKTNLCDFLAYVCDTSTDGFGKHKTTIEPLRFLELYSELEPGSSAIMEEGEQFDSRRGMTNQNVEASQKWQQARVREIVAFVNLPDPSMIDSRFEKLADYWINVERRGKARIYKKKIHRTKQKVYYKTMQVLEWPNMDGSATFRHMDRLKGDLLDGELDDDSLIRESEAQERVERAVREREREIRNEWITALKAYGLTGKEIAGLPVVDVSGPRVNQIARGE